jgi:NIMA (never in mitosis gene a)-related kinase 1/4/5
MSIKDFTILAKLGTVDFSSGEGAYSTVYKVERKADGQQYALKKVKLGNLSDKEAENALNEVRILASIHHQNIVSYKEAFLEGKSLWYISQQ